MYDKSVRGVPRALLMLFLEHLSADELIDRGENSPHSQHNAPNLLFDGIMIMVFNT